MKKKSPTWVKPKTGLKPYTDPKNSPLEPQKSKTTPKLSLIQNERIIENENCSTTCVDFKTVFEPDTDSKTYPNRAPNIQKDLSKLKVRIMWSLENKSYSAKWVDVKNFIEP